MLHVQSSRSRPTRRLSTVLELLSWRSSWQPDQVAIDVHGVATLTFGQWDAAATAVAIALRDCGVRAGDRVGLLFGARDWTEFAVAYCGVQRAGAAAVPISERLAPVQISDVLEHCSASAVMHGGSTTRPAIDRGIPISMVADLLAAGHGSPGTAGAPDSGRDDGREALDSQVRPGDLAQILYTSGTTGKPKGVGATHANLVADATTDPRRMPLGHSARFLHAFAIGTNAAQTMLFNALRARPSALTLPQFTPARFARLLESPGVGCAFIVPSMAVELLDSGVLRGRDLSGVHLIGSTAAPLPPAVASRLAETFPQAAIVNYYTSTEAAPAQTAMVFDPARSDAVGRAAGGTLMIADEAGEPLPAGATGDVWMRSPHARSYFRDQEATRSVFRDSWVRMGDVGRIDTEGYLYLVDRQQDIVKSGAYKISTLEIEAALHEYPPVADVAVVGVPHPVLGSAVAAAVVARPGAAPDVLALAAVRAFLSTRLADYQLPGRVLVLDELPRNDAGKVLKRQLIERFAAVMENGRLP
jgi:acyl-CoA synthetase (AMP-forming)/AMP-acid ligase II